MEIKRHEKFDREFKKYLKKYRTLDSDLGVLQKAIVSNPTGDKSKHWNLLRQSGAKCLFKVRMMCRSVKGSSFRVIYYYDGQVFELVFIEIYFKGDKEAEDKERIDAFWNSKI